MNKARGVLGFLNDLRGPTVPAWDGAGDDIDPMVQQVPAFQKPPTPRGVTEETPAGIINPHTGAEHMPNTDFEHFVQDALPANQIGSEEATSFDQPMRKEPVYEWQGSRWIGDLRWHPSLPKDLQPVDYILVPVSGYEHRVM